MEDTRNMYDTLNAYLAKRPVRTGLVMSAALTWLAVSGWRAGDTAQLAWSAFWAIAAVVWVGACIKWAPSEPAAADPS